MGDMGSMGNIEYLWGIWGPMEDMGYLWGICDTYGIYGIVSGLWGPTGAGGFLRVLGWIWSAYGIWESPIGYTEDLWDIWDPMGYMRYL